MMRAGERPKIVGEHLCSECHHEHKIASMGVMMVCGYCSCDEQGITSGPALSLPSDPFERLRDEDDAPEPQPAPRVMPPCELTGVLQRNGWHFWICACGRSGFGRRTDKEAREAGASHVARRA